MDNRRRQLLELRQSLTEVEDSGAEAEDVVELDQTRQGRLSRMDAMQAQAMSQATGAQRRALLQDIEAALARCDDGTFGECMECAEMISEGRLDATPTATLCINCAQALEDNP